jgi:di/tricarboxylate transporter
VGSELVGQSIHNNQLQRRFDVDVLELHRGNQSFSAPLADHPLQTGDRLLLRCQRQDLLRLRQEHTIALAPIGDADADVQELNAQNSTQRLVEVLLPSGSTIAGSSVRELRIRQRYNATLLAIRRGHQVLRVLLGKVVLQAGDVLLLLAPLDAIRDLRDSSDLVLHDELEKDMPTTNRKGVALVVALLVILLLMFKLINLMAAVLLGVVVVIASGCLQPGELQRAMQNTDLAKGLAIDLLHSLQNWPSYWVLVAVFLLAQLLTETLSKGVTVVLLMPIATELAKGMQLPPMAFIYAILFAASLSFFTPIGYQCNLMVMGPGRYRFLDTTRYGAPLTFGL